MVIVELRAGLDESLYASVSTGAGDGIATAHAFFTGLGIYGVKVVACPYTLEAHPKSVVIWTLSAASERIQEARLSCLRKPQPKSNGRIGGIEI